MRSMTEKNYQDIFFIGALWNLMLGLGSLIMFKTSMWVLFGKKAITKVITTTLPLRFFYISIALFGWGYYMVSRNLTKNRGIVWMGMVAKIIIFSSFIKYYILKQVKLLAVLMGFVDFIFTILFSIALWDTRKLINKA